MSSLKNNSKTLSDLPTCEKQSDGQTKFTSIHRRWDKHGDSPHLQQIMLYQKVQNAFHHNTEVIFV